MNCSKWLIYQRGDPFKSIVINNIDKKIPFDDLIESYDRFENGDYLLIHFGRIEQIPDFCKEIRELKTYIGKEVIILPISRSKRVPTAERLYKAAEKNTITQEILKESRIFWEEQCCIVEKKKIIAKLLGLAILIETAEIAQKKNDIPIFEKTKTEIDTEIKSEFEISQQSFDNLPEETIFLQEIIKAVKALFISTVIKNSKQIFEDIRDLKNKLEGSQKS